MAPTARSSSTPGGEALAGMCEKKWDPEWGRGGKGLAHPPEENRRGRGRGWGDSRNLRPSAQACVSAWCRRAVSIRESGWKTFDVTEAVNFWQQLSRPREPLLLQVLVQREHPGRLASSAHQLVRFSSQGPSGRRQGEPQLELHTLDLGEFG